MGKVQKRELRHSLKLQREQLCHLGDDHPTVTDRRGQGENNIAGREMQDGEGKGGGAEGGESTSCWTAAFRGCTKRDKHSLANHTGSGKDLGEVTFYL